MYYYHNTAIISFENKEPKKGTNGNNMGRSSCLTIASEHERIYIVVPVTAIGNDIKYGNNCISISYRQEWH